MADDKEVIIINKNRRRALWSLIIVVFFVPVSGWLVFMGLQPGRADVSWSLVLFGLLGIIAFSWSAILIIRTMHAPWRLQLTPSHLALYAPTYDLEIAWERILGIGVDEVNKRDGCVLVLDDVEKAVQGVSFHGQSSRPDAMTSSETMQARMKENFDTLGYHLAIPGRILEMEPAGLADLLTRARTGNLWQASEAQE